MAEQQVTFSLDSEGKLHYCTLTEAGLAEANEPENDSKYWTGWQPVPEADLVYDVGILRVIYSALSRLGMS